MGVILSQSNTWPNFNIFLRLQKEATRLSNLNRKIKKGADFILLGASSTENRHQDIKNIRCFNEVKTKNKALRLRLQIHFTINSRILFIINTVSFKVN